MSWKVKKAKLLMLLLTLFLIQWSLFIKIHTLCINTQCTRGLGVLLSSHTCEHMSNYLPSNLNFQLKSMFNKLKPIYNNSPHRSLHHLRFIKPFSNIKYQINFGSSSPHESKHKLISNGFRVFSNVVPSGWEELIEKEKASWKETDTTEEKIINQQRTLNMAEQLNNHILEVRSSTQQDDEEKPNRLPPRLWFVQPKLGPYCELMMNDQKHLQQIVREIRCMYTPDQLEIANVKMDLKLPLFEIFFSGPIPEEVRIFYARGATLQADVVPRFWSYCEILKEDCPLYYKYGGVYAPGLLPQFDIEGIIDEIKECMVPYSIHNMTYPVHWGWSNPGALTHENEHERSWWMEHVHRPTRTLVQKAFEGGVEDYRYIIREEYRDLMNEINQRKT